MHNLQIPWGICRICIINGCLPSAYQVQDCYNSLCRVELLKKKIPEIFKVLSCQAFDGRGYRVKIELALLTSCPQVRLAFQSGFIQIEGLAVEGALLSSSSASGTVLMLLQGLWATGALWLYTCPKYPFLRTQRCGTLIAKSFWELYSRTCKTFPFLSPSHVSIHTLSPHHKVEPLWPKGISEQLCRRSSTHFYKQMSSGAGQDISSSNRPSSDMRAQRRPSPRHLPSSLMVRKIIHSHFSWKD